MADAISPYLTVSCGLIMMTQFTSTDMRHLAWICSELVHLMTTPEYTGLFDVAEVYWSGLDKFPGNAKLLDM